EALGQSCDPRRVVEFFPLGTQGRNFVTLLAQLAAELGKTLGLNGGIEFDAIDVSGGEHQHSNHQEIKKAQDHGRPRIMSASSGNDGSRCSTLPVRAGASVRSAARNLAERARGLAASSDASGVCGRVVSARKVGGGAVISGRCLEPAGRRLRSARKVLTMRSSSE